MCDICRKLFPFERFIWYTARALKYSVGMSQSKNSLVNRSTSYKICFPKTTKFIMCFSTVFSYLLPI